MGDRWKPGGVRYVNQGVSEDDDQGENEEDLDICVVRKRATKPPQADLKINGKPLSTETDTGAAVSLISETKLKEMFKRRQ